MKTEQRAYSGCRAVRAQSDGASVRSLVTQARAVADETVQRLLEIHAQEQVVRVGVAGLVGREGGLGRRQHRIEPVEEQAVHVRLGGYVALAAALARPERVSHLVLTAAAGGLDTRALGAVDWRGDYRASCPLAAPWATNAVPDVSGCLPTLDVPTLLV